MTTKHKHDNPILVTGAAGAVGGIGRNLTEFLLAKGQRCAPWFGVRTGAPTYRSGTTRLLTLPL